MNSVCNKKSGRNKGISHIAQKVTQNAALSNGWQSCTLHTSNFPAYVAFVFCMVENGGIVLHTLLDLEILHLHCPGLLVPIAFRFQPSLGSRYSQLVKAENAKHTNIL